ncbi:hypothetical protein [Falsiroseomonas sp. HW251]|uniref:hypothetical protein n=1 Tax=Falsiroseomonas sp. HW251 TaxID=3390998 RepID=UPI003D3245D2
MRPVVIPAMLAIGLLAGCAGMPPPGQIPNLPANLQQGLAEPGREAINLVSSVFPNPATVRGRPAVAAAAVSDLEWLAASLPVDQRWTSMPPTVAGQVARGRDAVRGTFGIPAEASPNAVIAAFDGAAQALSVGNAQAASAALATVTGAGNAPRAVALLSDLPAIPAAAQAASQAQQGLVQMDQISGNRPR